MGLLAFIRERGITRVQTAGSGLRFATEIRSHRSYYIQVTRYKYCKKKKEGKEIDGEGRTRRGGGVGERVNEGLVVGHYLSIAMKRWRSVLDAGGSLFRLTLRAFFRRPIRR